MKNIIAFIIVSIISVNFVFGQSVAFNDIPENSNSSKPIVTSDLPYTLANESISKNESITVYKTVVDGETIYTLVPNYFKSIKSVYISFYKNGIKKTLLFNTNTFSKKDLTNFKESYGFTEKKKVCINVTTEKGSFVYGVQFDRPFDE